MNGYSSMKNHLKHKLQNRDLTLGMWVTLESASISEIATVMGLDWILIDAEHGHLGLKEIMEHVRATRNTETTPLVRIEEIEEGNIKRILDIGAEGILVPQVRTAEDVANIVRYAKYPPTGIRGIGAERATRWALGIQGYTATANENTLVIPMIENMDAVNNYESILKVPGIDAIFFGPHDLAASCGYLGEWGHPKVMEQISSMCRAAEAAGLPTGIMTANPAEARERRKEGFNMLAIGIDTVLMVRAAQEMMESLDRPVSEEVWNE